MPSDYGAAAVVQMLQAFTLLPFHAVAEGRNQSVRSTLAELTGLSKARIAKGHLDAVRPSTQRKIDKHLQGWLETKLDDPEALAYTHEKIATLPRTHSGKNALWAGWMHSFEFPPELLLPISKAVALAVDELVEELLKACLDDDLSKFKRAWLDYVGRHGLAARICDEPVAFPAPVENIDRWIAIECWGDAKTLTGKALDNLYLDMIAALDAEWGSYYFSGRQSKPLFPLVMVRPQDGLMETKRVASRKNVIYRPSRRLLEFMYSVLFKSRFKEWPAKPPGPKVLAHALDNPSEDKEVTAAVVSDHFDGSLKLTLDLTYDYWIQLYERFFPDKKASERPCPPFPMIMLALQWQTLLVQDKGQSFFLFDLEGYETLWRHRRQQWEARQAEQNKDRLRIDHSRREPLEWPAWMTNQSSSSSA